MSSSKEKTQPKLTDKQRAFVDAYCGEAHFNATKAAKLAGYSGNRNTLNSIGSQNLAKPAIREEIDRRLAAAGVTAQEVLSVLADQLRSSMDDFLTVPEGSTVALIDFDKIAAAGKLHLIKRYSWTQHGPRIELYDAQRAAELLGKALGIWRERVETEQVGEIVVRFERPEEDEVEE